MDQTNPFKDELLRIKVLMRDRHGILLDELEKPEISEIIRDLMTYQTLNRGGK